MTYAILQGFISACSQCVLCSFDINMGVIIKQIIRIGCGFMSDYMYIPAFQAWPLYE